MKNAKALILIIAILACTSFAVGNTDKIYYLLKGDDTRSIIQAERSLVDEMNSVDLWTCDFSPFRASDLNPESPSYKSKENYLYRVFKLKDIFQDDFNPISENLSLPFNRDLVEKRIMGIRVKYDQLRPNQWIYVYPASTRSAQYNFQEEMDGLSYKDFSIKRDQFLHIDELLDPNRAKQKPNYIQLNGYATTFSFLTWSSGIPAEYILYVEDYTGVVHEINFGELRAYGWNRLYADIPPRVKQYQYSYPYIRPLKVLGIKIYPKIKAVDEVYITYFSDLVVERYVKRDINLIGDMNKAIDIWDKEPEKSDEDSESIENNSPSGNN